MLPLIMAGMAVMQVAAGSQKGEIIREQAKLQDQINEMNAGFAEQDAFDAEAAGFGEAARYQNVIDSTIGDQRVGFASQNVDIGYGTAAEVQKESKITGMLNILELQRRGRMKAKGFKDEARNIRLTGAMRMGQANVDAGAAQSAGIMSGMNTLASGYAKGV